MRAHAHAHAHIFTVCHMNACRRRGGDKRKAPGARRPLLSSPVAAAAADTATTDEKMAEIVSNFHDKDNEAGTRRLRAHVAHYWAPFCVTL